jgi:hypothetical protein
LARSRRYSHHETPDVSERGADRRLRCNMQEIPSYMHPSLTTAHQLNLIMIIQRE